MTVDFKSQPNPQNEECPICRDTLLEGGRVISHSYGDQGKEHAFHEACLLEWFRRNDTCPSCRAKGTLEGQQITSPEEVREREVLRGVEGRMAIRVPSAIIGVMCGLFGIPSSAMLYMMESSLGFPTHEISKLAFKASVTGLLGAIAVHRALG